MTRRRIRACAAANGTDGWAAAEMVRRGWWGAQLSAEFSQWMLGLPPGWVTDVPGLSRADKLHILGNSVVPRQAAEAVDACLDDLAGVLARPGGEELQCLSAAVS